MNIKDIIKKIIVINLDITITNAWIILLIVMFTIMLIKKLIIKKTIIFLLIISLLCIKVDGSDGENNLKNLFFKFIMFIKKRKKVVTFLIILDEDNYEEYTLSKGEIKEVIDRVINYINNSDEFNNKQKIDSSILEDEEINEIYIYLLIKMKQSFISLEKSYKKELEYGQFITLITNHIQTMLYFDILERIEEKLKKLKK